MRSKILEGLRFFIENFPKDKGYIQRMQQLEDIDDVDFKTFQNTGLFIDTEQFKRAMPDADIKSNCECVVVYITLDHVQSLNSGHFVRGKQMSKDLSVIEKTIYNERYKRDL